MRKVQFNATCLSIIFSWARNGSRALPKQRNSFRSRHLAIFFILFSSIRLLIILVLYYAQDKHRVYCHNNDWLGWLPISDRNKINRHLSLRGKRGERDYSDPRCVPVRPFSSPTVFSWLSVTRYACLHLTIVQLHESCTITAAMVRNHSLNNKRARASVTRSKGRSGNSKTFSFAK